MNYLRAMLYLSATFALLALTWVFLEARRTVEQIGTTANAIEWATWAVPDRVGKELTITRTEVLNTLHRQGDQLRGDLRGHSNAWREMTNTRLVSAERLADQHLTAVGAEVVKLSFPLIGTLRNTEALTADAGRIAATVAEVSDVLLDCEGNPNCVQNRAIGTMRSVERAADSVAVATPKIGAAAVTATSNVAAITTDVHTVTQRIAAKPRWWERALSIVGNVGAGVARVWQ